MTTKFICFFDEVDFKTDKESFLDGLKVATHKYKKSSPDIFFTSNIKEFAEHLTPNSFAFIDYGGVGAYGGGMMEDYNSWIKHLIEDYPSVTFTYILTMGISWYGAEEIFDASNVKTVGGENLSWYISEIVKDMK